MSVIVEKLDIFCFSFANTDTRHICVANVTFDFMEYKHALIIIDVQLLFVENAGQETINHIYKLIDSENHDLVISTIFVNSPGSKYEKSLNYSDGTNVKDQILDPKVLSASGYIFKKEAYAPKKLLPPNPFQRKRHKSNYRRNRHRWLRTRHRIQMLRR